MKFVFETGVVEKSAYNFRKTAEWEIEFKQVS